MNGLKIIIAILVLAATVHTPIAQAEKVPVQLAQLEPEDYPDYVNSGVRKYNYGDYKGAISDYDQAYRLSPKEATAYSNRGAARAASGNKAGCNCRLHLRDNSGSRQQHGVQ